MNKQDITITNKLTDQQKLEASLIYFEAFSKKFATFWLFESNPEIGSKCLMDSLDFDRGMYAVYDNQVIGVMGLIFDNKEYKNLSYKTFRKYYSAWGSMQRVFWNFIIFDLFAKVEHEAIHVDAIAVSCDARSMGIGTMLLNKAFDMAIKKDYKRISLSVVDTNPRAKKLYEQLGFKVVKVNNYGRSTQRAGFSKEMLMVKEIS